MRTRTPALSGTNSAFLLALQQVLLTLPPLAIPRPPPSLKSHRWLVNVYDLELVVHSVELDGVRVLLLRMAPNDGVRVLRLRIVACTSSFCASCAHHAHS